MAPGSNQQHRSENLTKVRRELRWLLKLLWLPLYLLTLFTRIFVFVVVSETNNMIWKHIYHLAYRIQSLPFPLSYALEVTKKAVQKHQTKFRKQLRVMKILFLRTFFSTLFYFFLRGRVAFFTVLARFHSCFHIFIMVPLLDSPKLWDFLQLTSKKHDMLQSLIQDLSSNLEKNALNVTDKLSFMSLQKSCFHFCNRDTL